MNGPARFIGRKLLFILTLVLCSKQLIKAQNNVDKYFDDENLSKIKNLIKVGYNPIIGETTLLIERKLLTNFSMEGGIGIVSLKKQYDLYKDDPIPGLPHKGSGLNISVLFRIYCLKQFFDGFYIGLGGKVNFFDKTYFDLHFLNAGYQLPIGNHWALDATVGFGFKFYKITLNPGTVAEETEIESKLSIPLQLKVGYAF